MSSAKEHHRKAVFKRDPHECFYRHLHTCEGRLTAEHPIPVQTLRMNHQRAHSRRYAMSPESAVPIEIRGLRGVELEDLIADPTNGLIVCHKANTDLAAGILRPPRELLPEHVEDFAHTYELEWYLKAHYGEKP